MCMTTPERDNGTTRDDLLQRVALMETMIAEGRRNTGRFGWIFVLWGLVCLGGDGWSYLQPHSVWVWPIVIGSGFVIQFVGIAMHRRRGRDVLRAQGFRDDDLRGGDGVLHGAVRRVRDDAGAQARGGVGAGSGAA